MKNNYLESFCNAISDEREIRQTCFSLLYDTSITYYTPYLESEIMENLLALPSEKKDDYINFALDKINKTPLRNTDKNILDKWLKKFNVDLSTFPTFSNDELTNILKTYYSSHFFKTHKEQHYILDIQVDFFCYAAMVEAEKVITFLESKKNYNPTKKTKINSNNKKTSDSKVYDKILKDFKELREIENKIKEEDFNLDVYLQSNSAETPLSEIHAFDIQCLEANIKTNLEELYTYSLHNDFYYFDCPSKIYINKFEERKEAFFNRVPDANELDFLLNEVDYLSKPYDNRLVGIDTFYNYDKYIPYSDRYRISLKRKVEFLSSKLKPLNYSISYNENEILSDIFDKDQSWGTQIHAFYDGYIALNKKKLQDEETSNTINEKPSKQLTANQAVLLLDTLGFFNLDKIKNTSKEKQSKLISQLIGRHFKNIKTNIQNLDKKPSELGENHQKDIDKIDDILHNLE